MNSKITFAIFFTACLLNTSVAVHAQTPPTTPPPVKPPTPPKPCIAPEYRQFDFWIGDWDVTDPSGKAVGANLITPILGGCVLHESWVATGGGFVGQSHNVYDASRNLWHQTWVDMSGTLLLLEGRFDNGVMLLTDKNVPGKKDPNSWNEIAWSLQADGAVKQVWRTSTDAGKSWKIAFDGKYVKSSRSPPRTAR